MTKCNCETEKKHLKSFLMNVTEILKSNDTNKLEQIQHCLEHTHIFIIELKG